MDVPPDPGARHLNEQKVHGAWQTLEMLRVACDECTVSQKSVYKWYKLFTEGREGVNDDARPGWPSTLTTNENTEAVKKIVMENRRITIREVAEDVGISVGSFHAIFSGILGLKRVATKYSAHPTLDINLTQALF